LRKGAGDQNTPIVARQAEARRGCGRARRPARDGRAAPACAGAARVPVTPQVGQKIT
jgi:hypothetical protein